MSKAVSYPSVIASQSKKGPKLTLRLFHRDETGFLLVAHLGSFTRVEMGMIGVTLPSCFVARKNEVYRTLDNPIALGNWYSSLLLSL